MTQSNQNVYETRKNERVNSKKWKDAVKMAEWMKSDDCSVEQIIWDEYHTQKRLDKYIAKCKKLEQDLYNAKVMSSDEYKRDMDEWHEKFDDK